MAPSKRPNSEAPSDGNKDGRLSPSRRSPHPPASGEDPDQSSSSTESARARASQVQQQGQSRKSPKIEIENLQQKVLESFSELQTLEAKEQELEEELFELLARNRGAESQLEIMHSEHPDDGVIRLEDPAPSQTFPSSSSGE